MDLRYSPPQWQTAICLPDDPCKSLVDEQGTLLYHHHKYTKFGDNNNQYKDRFATSVAIRVADDARWVEQKLHSPRVPIVQTRRQSAALDIVEEAFAVTDVPGGAAATAPGTRQPRNDLILVRVTNRSDQPQTIHPKITIDTLLDYSCKLEDQRAVINRHETVTASLPIAAVGDEKGSRHVLELQPLSIAAKASDSFFLLYSGGQPVVVQPTTFPAAAKSFQRAVDYWEKAPLPYGRIQVPDSLIQGLVDSSIRNIWQAREIKDGLPAFQVGPTVYRNLWIVDGAFLLEAATILGAGQEARNGIRYTLKQQKPSGAFEVLSPLYFKENGIVVWTCVRHAMLTQDKAWLESVWPQLEKAIHYIHVLRERSLKNDDPLDNGLMPPGDIDGGLDRGDRAEYSNVYWNLLGLKAAIGAARWLGKADEAGGWQTEYADFLATFRKAAQRDMRKDPHGNAYLPTLMANRDNELPQRAQWAFCHAVYPGQIFAQDDPLVAGNLAMLAATEHEGMVYGTGWDAKGIWNYFASFYGHAWLWQGNGRKAARHCTPSATMLAPTLVWREEQSLRGEPFRKVGDMPHNWASTEFIRLVVHLLALDRGDELHLFEGLPAGWLKPAMVTRLDGVCTPFGPLSLELADFGRRPRSEIEGCAVGRQPANEDCVASQRLVSREGQRRSAREQSARRTDDPTYGARKVRRGAFTFRCELPNGNSRTVPPEQREQPERRNKPEDSGPSLGFEYRQLVQDARYATGWIGDIIRRIGGRSRRSSSHSWMMSHAGRRSSKSIRRDVDGETFDGEDPDNEWGCPCWASVDGAQERACPLSVLTAVQDRIVSLALSWPRGCLSAPL